MGDKGRLIVIAINVIQGLGAEKIKGLITSIGKDDTPEGEAARAALQGILACATASGKGADCGSAALGASGSVALNYLANSIGKDSKDLTTQEKEDRLNLINTILTGTVEALGGDAAAASIAAKIEMENNQYGEGSQSREDAWKELDGDLYPDGQSADPSAKWSSGWASVGDGGVLAATIVEGIFDIVYDPVNVLPVGKIIKTAGELGEKTLVVVSQAVKGKPGVALEIVDDLKLNQLGKQINLGGAAAGAGANKQVFEYGKGKVVATQADEALLIKEMGMLKQLDDLGLPVVKVEAVTVDGKVGMLMDRYAQGSKDIVKKQGDNILPVAGADISLLNERSIQDLKRIQRMMADKKIKIDDLQFLIGKDGSIVIADPLEVHTNTSPSRNNARMIRLLIEQAERNIK